MKTLGTIFPAWLIALIMHDDDIPEIPPAELDAVAEETVGIQRKRAEDGIASMQQRIAHYKAEIQSYLDAAEKFPDQTEGYMAQVRTLREEIRQCEQRIHEYELQRQGRN